MSTRPAKMIRFAQDNHPSIGLGSYTVATTRISRNAHGQHRQHHGCSCAAQASVPVRVGQSFERPSPSRHQCQLHSRRDPMTPLAPWPGLMAGDPMAPGSIAPF